MGPGGGEFGPGTFLAPQALAAADADGNGRLTPTEAAEAALRFVRDADTDKKGSIDEQALGRAINRRIERPDSFGPGGPPEGPDGPPPDDFGPGTFLAPRIVELADANKDGRISPDEEAGSPNDSSARPTGEARARSTPTPSARRSTGRWVRPPASAPAVPWAQERKLVKDFDKDGDGRLNRQERLAARDSEAERERARAAGPGRRGFGPPPGFGGEESRRARARASPPRTSKTFPRQAPLRPRRPPHPLPRRSKTRTGRPSSADFYRTDVEVPATLTVDGRKYPGVGVHFRGLSSFMIVQEGQKRSLNVSLDFVIPTRRSTATRR